VKISSIEEAATLDVKKKHRRRKRRKAEEGTEGRKRERGDKNRIVYKHFGA